MGLFDGILGHGSSVDPSDLAKRLDGRSAVAAREQLAHRLHELQRRAAGRVTEQHRAAGALREAGQDLDRIGRLVVDQRVHANHIVELAQRRVELGARSGDVVEIREGLEGDERVVVEGAGFLADGDLVRVVAASEG